MIRPSSLSLAEHCGLAPVLAAEFPETNANIERGNLVDREVCRELLGGAEATDPDAVACVEWLKTCGFHALAYVQETIALTDPVTGERITEGTADIVHYEPTTAMVTVVDLKKREQYLAGRTPDPDHNLQLHAYGLAWAIRTGAKAYRLALLLFGEGNATGVWSTRVFDEETWPPMLERMRRINTKHEAGGPRPLPNAGPHCVQCYQRLHCPSWMLPATQGETALTPLTRPGALTKDNAGEVLMYVMAVEEAAERAREILKGFARINGPIVVGDRQWAPTMMPGKKSGPTVKELEALGLPELIKQGKAYETWRMVKR